MCRFRVDPQGVDAARRERDRVVDYVPVIGNVVANHSSGIVSARDRLAANPIAATARSAYESGGPD
jgi:hypothetical protein